MTAITPNSGMKSAITSAMAIAPPTLMNFCVLMQTVSMARIPEKACAFD
jgi:hypothetical protein